MCYRSESTWFSIDWQETEDTMQNMKDATCLAGFSIIFLYPIGMFVWTCLLGE